MKEVNALQDFGSYGLLMLSTIMFGLMFLFNDVFRKNYGNEISATFVQNLGGGIFGFIVLVLINGFKFEFTIFAFIMAVISAVNGLLYTFCSLKALGKINLSLYALFSMLGGMVLPFLSGILFHGEEVTVGKIVCLIFVFAALFLTVEKLGKKSGTIYYIGIFVFNGMSGVMAKLYYSLPFDKVSSAGYSVLCALVSLLIAAVPLFFIKCNVRKINLASIFAMAGCGIFNRVANWFVLLALVSLPASAQYPFITGGTMIVSTVISLFSKNKPNKKEIIAVILAFIGVLVLVLLPDVKIFQISWR